MIFIIGGKKSVNKKIKKPAHKYYPIMMRGARQDTRN
jgi:hypothetical protein